MPSTPSQPSSDRASMFEDELDFDVSTFTQNSRVADAKADKDRLRALAEQRGFPSRDPSAISVPASPEPFLQRRYRTGRNRQLNLKVTDDALRRFYALADDQGKVLGEVFEQAVDALEKALRQQGQ